MKSDTAIKEFLEKYDENCMKSIDKYSQNFGARVNKKKFKVFNLQECFDNFQNYLKGYAKYKIDNINNSEASPQNAIEEKTKLYIEGITEDKEIEVTYDKLPTFVGSYPTGVKSLNETVDKIKHEMNLNDVDLHSIGVINEFVDQFITIVTESYDDIMENLLWASGYRSNQILFEGKPDPRKKQEHVFL